jgi:PAS domain-containing protein
MLSTQTKLRYVVGAGVLALLIVGGVALVATERIVGSGTADPNLRLAQALLGVLMLIAAVLAWFAYSSLRSDLDRRAAAEDALRASESKFAGILEIAADAIISVDERQRIVHYNNGAEKIFGWAATEALGQR